MKTLSKNWLKVIVWTVADGTIVDERKYTPNSIKRRIQFHLSRTEKIRKLTKLLSDMKIPFTNTKTEKTGVNVLQPYTIRIYGESARKIFNILDGKKRFPSSFALLSRGKLQVVLDTLADTDASRPHRKTMWRTTSKSDADVISAACETHEIDVKVKVRDHASGFKKDCKRQYWLNIAA